ncbi:MAG: ectoine/hydroxyectoine ABC transporter ATP-binding protein EhuA [Candidatus Sumerlaeia bacterium]|nr:ectoine/hydroxyectoine ABC transporter ATP-binding protein EhuA [Candidatus Sumerlaeia bacterium]
MIRIRNLEKNFGSLKVLQGIDLDIPAKQVVSIIGPSGSGKSTLLRLLMTLERPDGGHVEIDGEPFFTMPDGKGGEIPANNAHISRIRRKIGMVFQHFNLFPHMTVLQNVIEAPRSVMKLSKEEAVKLAKDYLEDVGLSDKLDVYPARLSGGQKQRVAIARALALQPKIMLFDEITSALDPELVGGILDLLKRIADTTDTTMLIVTHEMRFARESSDRILFFDKGVILEDGHPDKIFTAPDHARTNEFLRDVL